VTKNGRNAGAKMAVFVLEDLQGSCEVVLFPKSLEKNAELLEVDKIVFVKGKVDSSRENSNVIADELIDISEVSDKLSARVQIKMSTMDVTDERINSIRSVCETYRGKSPLHISLLTNDGHRVWLEADRKLSVRPDTDLYTKLESVVGAGNVELLPN
ncbi:MAG: hypothetical protein KAS23_04990, partial [Anaerohalosphaera sp.]|nr:hypothetical protein [Anaerohalosphaera sp.]